MVCFKVDDRRTMFNLLRLLNILPLEFPVVNLFLHRASDLVLARLLTTDNWAYLAHLLNYRIQHYLEEKSKTEKGG